MTRVLRDEKGKDFAIEIALRARNGKRVKVRGSRGHFDHLIRPYVSPSPPLLGVCALARSAMQTTLGNNRPPWPGGCVHWRAAQCKPLIGASCQYLHLLVRISPPSGL